MTRQTTALLSAGPRFLAPWGDRGWRIALTAQLVEGGSSAYWLPTATQPALYDVSPSQIEIAAPSDTEMLDSTLMLLASHLGGEKAQNWLLDHHNMSVDGGQRILAPFWEIAETERQTLSDILSPHIRIGVTVLEENSLATQSFVRNLGVLGFDVDVFGALKSSLAH